MKTINPGHVYQLDFLLESSNAAPSDQDFQNNLLTFVRHVGAKYPGNKPPGHPGTTTQEVLRALIARSKYVDRQAPNGHNEHVLYHLRQAMWHLEARALGLRDQSLEVSAFRHIEDEPTCPACGHIRCALHKF